MQYRYRNEGELRINADLPEPIPSLVKVVRALEHPQGRLLQLAGRLITLASVFVDQSLEIANLLVLAAQLLYERAEIYSIGLVKYASAHGSAKAVGTATATMIPPEEQSD